MAAHIEWNGHAIGGLADGAIQAYSNLSISFGTKTKAKDGNDVLYIGRQGYNAAKVEVTLEPRAALGQNVEEVITSFKNDNRSGALSRLLLGGRDLFGADFLLTDVDVSAIQSQPKTGRMTGAKVKLTWQESDGQVYDNTSSSSTASASTEQTETSKGTGSKYLKSQKEKSGETDAVSGADGKSGGNLTGMMGGYNTSGISGSAKKSSSALETVKKVRDATGGTGSKSKGVAKAK